VNNQIFCREGGMTFIIWVVIKLFFTMLHDDSIFAAKPERCLMYFLHQIKRLPAFPANPIAIASIFAT